MLLQLKLVLKMPGFAGSLLLSIPQEAERVPFRSVSETPLRVFWVLLFLNVRI